MSDIVTTDALPNLFHQLNLIQEAERLTVALIPSMSNDELLSILEKADAMESAAWRIKCAAHAEIKNRCEKRGEKGALIEAAAKQAGVTTKTIYLNAQIHELAEQAPDIEDKQVFIEVLSLPKEDRVEALETIANKLQSDKPYGPGDIKADIYMMRRGELQAQTETVSNVSLRLSQPAMVKLTTLRSKTHQTPTEIVERLLWAADQPAESGPCIRISGESLNWLIEKAGKRVAQYGVDDDWGTPESYLEGVVMARAIRDSQRSHKAKG